MNDLIVQLRDPRQRFLFQGSRPFALSIANALEAKGREVERLKADIKFLCSGAAHHVDDVAEIERLRGLLSRARNSVVADARAAYNTDLPLTASNLNALVARIDAALGPHLKDAAFCGHQRTERRGATVWCRDCERYVGMIGCQPIP